MIKAGAGALASVAASTKTLAYEPSGGNRSVEVTIRRDEYGVPHVYSRGGDGAEAVLYGYGYAIAEDRLFQLEMYRRFYRGTVSAVLGSDWIEFDREARIDHHPKVPLEEQIKTQLDDEHRMALEAYAEGINRHIDAIEAGEAELHRGFVVHDFKPESWTREDVAGVFAAAMIFFSGATLETLNAAILSGLRERHDGETAMALFDDFQWGDDPDAPTSADRPNPGYVPPYTPAGDGSGGTADEIDGTRSRQRVSSGEIGGRSNQLTGGDSRLPASPVRSFERERERRRTIAGGLDDLGLTTKLGSKALVVHGDITESGDALMMGGPQMSFSTPSVMYEVGLHGPNFDVAGVTVAGFPFVMFGHNRYGAIGTTAGIDKSVQSFVESVVPREDGPDQYEFRGETHDIETEIQTIPVAGAEDERVAIRRTHHGIVTEYNPDAGEAIAQTRGFDGRDMNSFRAFYDAQFATSVDEFHNAARHCDYAVNFLWAGTDGNIGFFHLGRYPDAEAVPWDTRLPADGTTHELSEDDILRAADGDVPYVINPDAGYAANWNNKPAPDWDNGDKSFAWSVDHRVQRIINLVEHRLAERGAVDYEFLKHVVYDTSFVDLRAIRYKQPLLDSLADADLDDIEADAADALRAWDDYRQGSGEDYLGPYSPGLVVFDAFFDRLLKRTFEPVYGPLFDVATIVLDYRYGRGTLMRALNPEKTALNTAVDYFDGDPDGTLRGAFRDVVAELRAEYGENVAEWESSPAIDPLSNQTLFGVPVGIGDAGEMPRMNRGTENHFVRLGEEIVAENVLPPGNSGHVGPDGSQSTHYDDQLNMFTDFQYKDLLFEPGEVAARSEVSSIFVLSGRSDVGKMRSGSNADETSSSKNGNGGK